MLPVGTVLEASYYCRLDGKQNAINVVHYRLDTAVADPSTMDTVAAALSSSVATEYKAFMHAGNAYDGLKLRIPGPLGTAAVISRNGAGAGTNLGAGIAPTQLCIVTSLRSATAPARVRGRIYFGGFCNADIDVSGNPTVGLIALANSLLDKVVINPKVIVVAGVNITLTPVIYQRGLLLVWPITSRVVRTAFGTQRRRSEINRGDQAL